MSYTVKSLFKLGQGEQRDYYHAYVSSILKMRSLVVKLQKPSMNMLQISHAQKCLSAHQQKVKVDPTSKEIMSNLYVILYPTLPA